MLLYHQKKLYVAAVLTTDEAYKYDSETNERQLPRPLGHNKTDVVIYEAVTSDLSRLIPLLSNKLRMHPRKTAQSRNERSRKAAATLQGHLDWPQARIRDGCMVFDLTDSKQPIGNLYRSTVCRLALKSCSRCVTIVL